MVQAMKVLQGQFYSFVTVFINSDLDVVLRHWGLQHSMISSNICLENKDACVNGAIGDDLGLPPTETYPDDGHPEEDDSVGVELLEALAGVATLEEKRLAVGGVREELVVAGEARGRGIRPLE